MTIGVNIRTIVGTYLMAEGELGGVDRRDPIPLHHQVRRALLRYIHRELLGPGDQLPPEPDLCQAFGVSRHTLRQAVDRLVQEGILIRQRPRGTFVDFGAVAGNLRVHRSVWEDLRRLELNPEARLVSEEVIEADGEICTSLEIPPGSKVIRLERVFLAAGDPIVLVVSYFRHEEFAWLLREDPTASWYELMEKRGGPAPDRARQLICATPANEFLSRHLDCQPGFPLLETLTRTISQDGQVISYSHAWFRSDRYHFAIDLPHRPASAVGAN